MRIGLRLAERTGNWVRKCGVHMIRGFRTEDGSGNYIRSKLDDQITIELHKSLFFRFIFYFF